MILHNAVRDAVHGFAKESGNVTFLEPTAIVVPAPPQARQKVRPDIAIRDYEMADTLHPNQRSGIVVDVVTAQPITAKGKPHRTAARDDGHAAHAAHDKKLNAYRHKIARGRHEVIPFAVETYGRLHPAALGLLDRMSRCAARRHKTHDPADFSAHNSGHIRHRWICELSTVAAHSATG